MNWTPGDYFYHRQHGYQKVSHVDGVAIWFWGQPCRLFISDGKTTRKPDGPLTSTRIPIGEAIACTKEEAIQGIQEEAIQANQKITASAMPDIKASAMPPSERQKLKTILADLKSTAKKEKVKKEVFEPPDLEYFAKKAPPQKQQEQPKQPKQPKRKTIPTPPRVEMERQSDRFDKLRTAMTWLERHQLPAIPVAPVVKFPDFNTKNPSWIDIKGYPHQIKWRRYTQGATPSAGDKAKWWANLENGLGTFSGVNNIYWVDIDRKHFDCEADCEAVARNLWKKTGGTGLLEKTQSGGWRFPFRYYGSSFKTFSFSLIEGGDPIGEILGSSQFVVMGPSLGQLGNYETVQRTLDIPVVDSISEFFGIAKKYRRSYSETYDNPDFVRFPARIYQHFGRPMALWLLARSRDESGSGRAILSVDEITALTGRSVSSIRRWTNKARQKGLFNARGFTTSDGQGFIEIFYASKERACFLAGVDLGPVGLVNIKEDLESLHIAATDILALDLQKQSRHAQYQEQIEKVSQKLNIGKNIASKKAVKPIKPEILGKPCQPCENKMARVLWQSDRYLLVSEGFAAYGASLNSIAGARGLSVRQVNRHLVKSYREAPSPQRGFREGIKPIEKRQIVQRLARSEMNDRLFEGLKFHAGESGEVSPGKFARDRAGRFWERKTCVMAPTFRLVSCRFRRSRLAKISDALAA